MSVFYIFDIVIIALVVFRPIFLLLNTYLLIIRKLCGWTSLALPDFALGGRFLERLRFLGRQLFTEWISVYREGVSFRFA